MLHLLWWQWRLLGCSCCFLSFFKKKSVPGLRFFVSVRGPSFSPCATVLQGKISRDDVAAIMVEALEKGKPNVTFEVKSTIPFSQPWEGPEEEVTRDWPAFFGAFQEGITGKTVDGVYEKEAITA